MDPSGKNGLFAGFSEKSKAYRIYIPRYHQIEISRDVSFDEDIAFRKSRKDKEVEEEHETPKAGEVSKPVRNEVEEQIHEDHGMTEPQRLEELSSEMISHKRRHAWPQEVIKEAKRFGVPEGTIRERTYVLLCGFDVAPR